MMPRIPASDKLEHLLELAADLNASVVEAAAEGVPAHEAEGEIWQRALAVAGLPSPRTWASVIWAGVHSRCDAVRPARRAGSDREPPAALVAPVRIRWIAIDSRFCP